MVISLVHEKGGASKTTLALSLAYYLIEKGRDVLFVDADTSGNATSFNDRRIENEENLLKIPMVSKTGKGLKNEIRNLVDKYDFIIIDTPGREAIEMQQALFVSDIAIMPTLPSQFDIDALDKTLEIFEKTKEWNENLIGVVLASRASSNPMVSDGRTLVQYLKETIEIEDVAIYDEWISERIVYRKGGIEGKTVFEMGEKDKNGVAAKEMRNFFDVIYGLIGNKE